MNTEHYQFDYDSYLHAQHLSSKPEAPAPDRNETQLYLRRICKHANFLNADDIADGLLDVVVWDAQRQILKVDGLPIQKFLREAAEQSPELLKPKRELGYTVVPLDPAERLKLIHSKSELRGERAISEFILRRGRQAYNALPDAPSAQS